jgi:hypothetical protein
MPRRFILLRPPWRTIIPGVSFLLLLLGLYHFWQPGEDIRDGRNDRGRNGLWLGHGWLGDDGWFERNNRTNQLGRFRSVEGIRALAKRLREHGITDVFPHLCPAEPTGPLPPVDHPQVERFLDEMKDFRVIVWIGGPNGTSVLAHSGRWRTNFCDSISALFKEHPRLAGVQLNVEPCTTGNEPFLVLLEDVRRALPSGKLLSVAAYPPPTRWHRFPDVHWDEDYFRKVADRSDQLAVMMYDTAIRHPKAYIKLMADWTQEILAWSNEKPVLLGVPAYADAHTDYHDPKVENLENALLGIHAGLGRQLLPTNYQGVAIYSEWETDEAEWLLFGERFNQPKR